MTPIHFAEPAWLPLLVAPAALLCAWVWRYARRRRDAARLVRHRDLPGASRTPASGDLLWWLCLLFATAATILAMARPQIVQVRARTAGIDLVILQDGSASMRVRDVRGDRWQRSMAFLRALGESLRWEEDRVALTLFAHIATPQIRLTRDPNTYFFFLDHLDVEPPFRLEDEGTWDTNIEGAVHWGLRLIEKDEEIAGPSPNVRAFVLLSDGQAWSGEIARSLALATARNIPLHVIGVGTTAGGIIPQPQRGTLAAARLASALDRRSLAAIATAGGGRYFELDRETDTDIASTIIDFTRRRAAGARSAEGMRDLYWEALLVAAGLVLAATLLQRERTMLAWQAVAAGTLLTWFS